MRILIIGGSGLLGKALWGTAKDDWLQANEVFMTWFSNNVGLPMYQMDVCDQSQIAYIFDLVKPEVVIHTAAIGSVDFAEKNYEAARAVNVTGTGNVLAMAKHYGAKFVYISSNAVFDGNNPPYSEDSTRIPINKYGQIKLEAEDLVISNYDNYLIIRPFLLYGWPWPYGRQNWMTLIEGKLSTGGRIQLVDDVYWQPTSAQDVARTIWRLVEMSQPNEIYHIAGPDRITLYQFGKLVCRRFGLDSRLLEPVSHTVYNHLAPRPLDTTYDTSKAARVGIVCKSVEEGLKEL